MSDMFDVDASEVVRWAARTANAPAIIRDEMLRSTDRLTLQGAGFAQGLAPVRTGHLRRSIAHKAASFGGGGATGSYGTATPYARPVEFGRRGFSAGPGRMLRLTVGGQVLYRKSVGPARARPFMRPSIERLRPLVPREYQSGLKRAMTRIGGG